MLPYPSPMMAGLPATAINSPLDIAGSSFWYDAKDAATLWQDTALSVAAVNGQPIGGVTDKSGNGRFLQQISTSRPTYNSAGGGQIDFDGFNDSLVYIGTNVPCGTVFAVARLIGSSNDAGLVTNRTDQALAVDVALSKNGAADQWYVSQSAGNTLANATHIWENRVQTINYTASAKKIWVADGSGFPSTLQFPTGICIGNDRTIASRNMNCTVYEIIGYGSVLSATDRNRVEDYLAAKHGITI